MIADGQVLVLNTPHASCGRGNILPHGVVLDVPEAKLTGPSLHATRLAGYVGSGYAHDNKQHT